VSTEGRERAEKGKREREERGKLRKGREKKSNERVIMSCQEGQEQKR
jgi:hypothetical protein